MLRSGLQTKGIAGELLPTNHADKRACCRLSAASHFARSSMRISASNSADYLTAMFKQMPAPQRCMLLKWWNAIVDRDFADLLGTICEHWHCCAEFPDLKPHSSEAVSKQLLPHVERLLPGPRPPCSSRDPLPVMTSSRVHRKFRLALLRGDVGYEHGHAVRYRSRYAIPSNHHFNRRCRHVQQVVNGHAAAQKLSQQVRASSYSSFVQASVAFWASQLTLGQERGTR